MFSREDRVARDLLNMVPYDDCVDGTYGEEDDDYSDDEHAKAWEHTDVDRIDRDYTFHRDRKD